MLGIDLGQYQDNTDAEELELWPWHLEALEAFFAICSQWRVIAIGARIMPIGLDYTAAQSGLQLAGLTVDADMWGDIRTIEQGALAEIRRMM